MVSASHTRLPPPSASIRSLFPLIIYLFIIMPRNEKSWMIPFKRAISRLHPALPSSPREVSAARVNVAADPSLPQPTECSASRPAPTSSTSLGSASEEFGVREDCVYGEVILRAFRKAIIMKTVSQSETNKPWEPLEICGAKHSLDTKLLPGLTSEISIQIFTSTWKAPIIKLSSTLL